MVWASVVVVIRVLDAVAVVGESAQIGAGSIAATKLLRKKEVTSASVFEDSMPQE